MLSNYSNSRKYNLALTILYCSMIKFLHSILEKNKNKIKKLNFSSFLKKNYKGKADFIGFRKQFKIQRGRFWCLLAYCSSVIRQMLYKNVWDEFCCQLHICALGVILKKLVQFKTANKYRLKINFFTYLPKLSSGFNIRSTSSI